MEVLNVIFMALFGIYLLFDAVLPALALLFAALWGLSRMLWRMCRAALGAIRSLIRH